MTRNHEVAERFIKSRGKDESIKTNNVYIENGVIYSYGSHFKMGLWFNDFVVINWNDYSSTTAKHKSYLVSECNYNGVEYVFIPDCDLNKSSEQIKRNEDEIKRLTLFKQRQRVADRIADTENTIKDLKRQNKLMGEIVREVIYKHI